MVDENSSDAKREPTSGARRDLTSSNSMTGQTITRREFVEETQVLLFALGMGDERE